MIKHFRIIPFLIGASIGLYLVYNFHSDTPTVFRYPSPENVDKLTYRDKNGVCYKYKSTEVDCNKNEKTLKQYPIQN
jgi:hypothetical protein